MFEVEIHPSWNNFFTKDVHKLLNSIIREIKKGSHTPNIESSLRFLSRDLHDVKVIILGMDPYPQKGRATGRAFEDGSINTWSDLRKNPSLTNILKLLYANETGENILPIAKVRSALKKDEIIAPPKQLFDSWEEQGILLLNVGLTCEIGKSASHIQLWKPFMGPCIEYIKQEAPSSKWLLWGLDAQKVVTGSIYSYCSNHPRLYSRIEGSFLHNNHFSKITEIDWTGKNITITGT